MSFSRMPAGGPAGNRPGPEVGRIDMDPAGAGAQPRASGRSFAEERAQMLHRKSSRTGGDLPEITRPLPRSGRAVASPRGEALRAAGTAGRTEGEREGGRKGRAGKGEREREAGLRQQQGGAPSLAIRATACPRKRHGAALYPGKKTASSKTKRRSSWGAEEEEEEEEKQGRRREASTTPANKALCCDSLPFRPRPPGLRQEEQGKGRRGKAMQGPPRKLAPRSLRSAALGVRARGAGASRPRGEPRRPASHRPRTRSSRPAARAPPTPRPAGAAGSKKAPCGHNHKLSEGRADFWDLR
ncbi:unnamed protein product [Prorocentrum cordatum]|uniref:Uncharacterized protein n=1 Tax=Prorocentrum cordatum TaxID=2364126 RepID=A0ABN9SEW3_9DINO|nr:unnamed protein product [Polarella glacialis]